MSDQGSSSGREASDDPLIGQTIADRYRIQRRLGAGGMGVVYLAEHVLIEKLVAVKVLSEDFARKPDVVQRFMQEAKAASKIGHPNIVDITDFGETPSKSVFFVMENLEGSDLAHHVRKSGPMPVQRVRNIMNQLCRALAAAHSKGIIHRDLKPENVFLVSRDGRNDFVKVLDFGIAKMSALNDEGARLTKTGMIFGTPEYMSPEQAKGERPDHRVDIYSSGCILYELLTGDVPFRAESFMGILTKHLMEEPESPSKRAPHARISPDMNAVVLKALSKDKNVRFQSMKEFALAIEQAAGGSMVDAWANEASGVNLTPSGSIRPVAVTRSELNELPQRKLPVVPILAGVVVVAGALGVLAIQPWKKHEIPVVAVVAPPTPAPAAPAAKLPAQEHTIVITSPTPGAEVFRGAERLGPTPLKTLRLQDSTTSVELSIRAAGFQTRTVSIIPDRDREYDVTLLPAPAAPAPAKPAKPSRSSSRPTAKPAAPEPATAPAQPKPAKLRDLKDPFN